MKKNWKHPESNIFEIYIYNQRLQLIHNGSYSREQEHQLRRKISQCSWLFNLDNAGYFLKNV